jgi:hypothetical protein
MHVAKILLMTLVGCTAMNQHGEVPMGQKETNADVFMNEERTIFVNYDEDKTTTISAVPESHAYKKYIQLTDDLRPGQKRRLHVAVSTFLIEADRIKVFAYMDSTSGTVEPSAHIISKNSKEYRCYVDVVGGYTKNEITYLRKTDKARIDKCLNDLQ